ncbi:T9SS type A sorting domain-containing protein [Aureisphaera galaxeae]|uniref:T9SS type A sorting domain-containing protein n=1 Tax=Aureisphaera galaxeae TaxID=1538023 RepID=UPI0023504146|nr:T9SS type A sorting domain-containing protein [Aureisphaera galaxeae]MDC8002795.1 T9SS type A sorting domain-containing protein [Aureisphaera galaxeae]
MRRITLLLALFCASFTFAQAVKINEVDADQTSTDTMEFIELLSQNPSQSLDGYIVVLYNGNGDTSYTTVDLNGFTTDANGFLIIGSDAVPGVDIALGADNTIQNGADAIAIYQDSAANFPDGTPVTSTNLIDAIVYDTNDNDDPELLAGLGLSVQYNEDANGNKDIESIQRGSGDTFCVGAPTLRAANIDCGAVCALNVFVVDVTCDAITSGTDTYTTTLNFEGGGTDTYTITSTEGTISGDDPSSQATGEIIISGVNEGVDFDYSVTSTLCNITNTINAPDCDPGTDVSDIATLRGSVEGNVYTLTGEAILTFQQDFRNQKFIEDATGAILIDDTAANITTTYAIGDGISGLIGTLSSFNGMMQFVPVTDPGAPTSTGNTVTPQEVSITELNSNAENYESEYVSINPAVDIGGAPNPFWEVGTVYSLTNGDGSFNFRTSFFDANYIGQDIPTNAVFIAGIITERADDGGYYITARDNNDASTTLGIGDNDNNAFVLYPNPAQTQINIVSQLSGEKTVAIFDISGKKVIDQTMSNDTLDISQLTSGMYIVKIAQESATSTKKLIVR